MAQWLKTQIQRDNGELAEAQAPVIISASRSSEPIPENTIMLNETQYALKKKDNCDKG